jgi:hypothetical protein
VVGRQDVLGAFLKLLRSCRCNHGTGWWKKALRLIDDEAYTMHDTIVTTGITKCMISKLDECWHS